MCMCMCTYINVCVYFSSLLQLEQHITGFEIIYTFSKYLLSSHIVSGIVLHNWDIQLKKTEILTLILVGRHVSEKVSAKNE